MFGLKIRRGFEMPAILRVVMARDGGKRGGGGVWVVVCRPVFVCVDWVSGGDVYCTGSYIIMYSVGFKW